MEKKQYSTKTYYHRYDDGRTVAYWWDPISKNWIIYEVDHEGNQKGDAEFAANKSALMGDYPEFKFEQRVIAVLEGAPYCDDDADNLRELYGYKGYKVVEIANLYEEPEKIKQLVKLNPEFIYINTTGTYREKTQKIREIFFTLNWLPKYVLFANEMSIMNGGYVTLARKLRKEMGVEILYGPQSAWLGIEEFDSPEQHKMSEISWL